jgi:hypothetical protein
MPSNTTYNPIHVADFDKTRLLLAAQGVTANASYGTSTNLDLLLSDDCLLTGLVFFTNSGAYGDYANLQIVDTTGITGAPPGTVLDQVATNWYICPNQYFEVESVYPAKIMAGLTIRLVYTSTSIGVGSTFVAVNYILHKCLI